VARTRIPEAEALNEIRQAVREIDPNIALFETVSMTGHLSVALFPARIAGAALGAFGVLAAILAGTGIFGMMAYAVSRRTREIGIRVAIGAGQWDVLRAIGRRAAILIGCGAVVGLAASVAAGRLLGSILYGIEPGDPVTLATVIGATLAIAAVASWTPVLRALRVDPLQALRQE
jgi:ABC-type antimicrobial peptide transport system permease subunit